jgi:hypothetical protein
VSARFAYGNDSLEREIDAIAGGFYLLRFINPIVVAPESIGLVDVPITKVNEFLASRLNRL